MHAYIITGGTPRERNGRITRILSERSVSTHDAITIAPGGPSLTVDDVRGIISRLSIRPLSSPRHGVVVRDAHTMTAEAQNAFLKTLEEPPGAALIILETYQPDALLPTILSRCQLVNLGSAPSYTDDQLSECMSTITTLIQSPVGKRLQIIDTLTRTRDDALAFVNVAICTLEQELKQRGRSAILLRALLTARTQILGNVNPKLALDHVLL